MPSSSGKPDTDATAKTGEGSEFSKKRQMQQRLPSGPDQDPTTQGSFVVTGTLTTNDGKRIPFEPMVCEDSTLGDAKSFASDMRGGGQVTGEDGQFEWEAKFTSNDGNVKWTTSERVPALKGGKKHS